MTSIERTAYPRFKRLITAHELHLFFTPTREEAAWAAERMDSDERQLPLLLALKSYQRMGRFPKPEEHAETVVDFVRRAVELPEGTVPLWGMDRTAERQRTEVRRRMGVVYRQAEARWIAEQPIRKEASAKNRPADLINIALEKVVEAGLELPGFSTFDKMASKIRREVNASICAGIHDRTSVVERAGLLRLLEERDGDATLFNRLKKPAQRPSWSHFKLLAMTDAHQHTSLAGPSAEQAARRLEEFADRPRFGGTVVTDRRRLKRLMERGDPAVCPGAYVTCVHDHAKALCRPRRDTAGRDRPDLGTCRPLPCSCCVTRFSQWVGFGNRGVIADNDLVEPEKAMKFDALLTNAVIFHNALTSRRSCGNCWRRGGRSTRRTWRTSRRT